jgi:tetratricopeptide (TPR) repeat protein
MKNYKVNNVFKILLLAIIMILLSSSALIAADIQYNILILPTASIGNNTDYNWMTIAVDKVIEFTVEHSPLFGILKEKFIINNFNLQFSTNNPYKINEGLIANFAKAYRAHYAITSQYNYNKMSDTYEIDVKIIETKSNEIIKAFSTSGSAKEALTIANLIAEGLADYHDFKLRSVEKNFITNNEFCMDEKATYYWCIAYKALHNNRVDKALEYFNRSIVFYKQFSEAYRMVAYIRTLRGESKAADSNFKNAINCKVTNFRVWRDYAYLYHLNKNYKIASNFYTKALDLKKIDVEIFARIGSINYELGFYDNAKTWYQRAYNVYDLNPIVLEGLAKIEAYQSNNWETAYMYASTLLDIESDNAEAYIIIANYYAIKKDYKNALNMMVDAVKNKKNYIEGHYMIGVLYSKYYQETGNIIHHEQSLKAFEYCISKSYNIPDIYIQVARLYAMISNGEKAAKYIDLAFKGGFMNIDAILFDKVFDNVTDDPTFNKTLTYWYNKFKGGGGNY